MLLYLGNDPLRVVRMCSLASVAVSGDRYLLSYSVTWRYEARLLHTVRLGQRAAAVGVAACASRAALVCLLIAEVVVRVGL
jgi:hypothetical protein